MIAMLALALTFALATWAAGWWGVLVIAFAAGALWRRTRCAESCAVAAAVGWALLLAGDAMSGRLGVLGRGLGGLFHVPGAVLILVSLLFAAGAAWSAAAVGAELGRMMRDGRGAEESSAAPL